MPTLQDIEIPDSAARNAAVIEELPEFQDERMVLNMGPSHPATHGVLRIVLELDGEVITKADVDIGYLHRGDEKIAENMTYTQFIPYTDRLDYLAPLANNVAYALAVEKLLGIHDKLPPRCQYIRVMVAELARISAHLLGVGAFAMDTGAVTVFLLIFTEREKIYNLAEAISGARFTTSYTRIGGLLRLAARQLFGGASADQQLAVFPDLSGPTGHYRVNGDINLIAPIAKAIALKLGISNRYDTRPQADVQKNDTTIQSGVAVEF